MAAYIFFTSTFLNFMAHKVGSFITINVYGGPVCHTQLFQILGSGFLYHSKAWVGLL